MPGCILVNSVAPGPAPAVGRVLLLAASTALLAHFAQKVVRASRGDRAWVLAGPLSGLLVLAGVNLGPVGREVMAAPVSLAAGLRAAIDAYDAMTSDRPYRKAVAPAEAVAELRRCAGTQFDPVLVETFIDVLADFRN